PCTKAEPSTVPEPPSGRRPARPTTIEPATHATWCSWRDTAEVRSWPDGRAVHNWVGHSIATAILPGRHVRHCEQWTSTVRHARSSRGIATWLERAYASALIAILIALTARRISKACVTASCCLAYCLARRRADATIASVGCAVCGTGRDVATIGQLAERRWWRIGACSVHATVAGRGRGTRQSGDEVQIAAAVNIL